MHKYGIKTTTKINLLGNWNNETSGVSSKENLSLTSKRIIITNLMHEFRITSYTNCGMKKKLLVPRE